MLVVDRGYDSADAMRRILIDHARAKGTIKRGGGRRRLPLDVLDLACEALFPEAVAIDDAVSRLQEFSPTVAEVVRLLQETLDEEAAADKKLSALAENRVNTQARHP